MNQKQKELMYSQIRAHGENLNKIFNTGLDPVTLCKKLHTLENKAHRLAEDYCNGIIKTEQWEEISEKTMKSLDKILNFTGLKIPCELNPDARGYALKIDSDFMRENQIHHLYQDMGGYGIIAPDFDGTR